MLKFTFVRGARAGTTLEVPQRWPIRLGRHPDNEVQFDAEVDRQVSTFHAEIVDGKLMLVRGASGMAGQLWVFSQR
jgi:hypothetical protein